MAETKTTKTIKPVKATKAKYFYAIGRRKTATASVRLFNGKGDSTINEKLVKEYFPVAVQNREVYRALELTGKKDEFHFTAKTKGGGIAAQVEALRLAIARALIKSDETLKTELKQKKLLTRDSRMVERKHTGHIKARKSEQYSKR